MLIVQLHEEPVESRGHSDRPRATIFLRERSHDVRENLGRRHRTVLHNGQQFTQAVKGSIRHEGNLLESPEAASNRSVALGGPGSDSNLFRRVEGGGGTLSGACVFPRPQTARTHAKPPHGAQGYHWGR